jgi:hypothetical protein
MATLEGAILQDATASQGGRVTPDMDVYAAPWLPGAQLLPLSDGGELSRTVAAAFARSIPGARLRDYTDDFYHRVHVIPGRLDMGNVASVQIVQARIWNAHLEPQSLEAIDAIDADGITLTGSVAPVTVTPLQELHYEVSVDTAGPPVADARYAWQFDGLPAAVLAITATRIIPFGWAPDWADGVRERLSWLTGLFRSPKGAEQRRALRLAPRRTFSAALILEGRERQAFDLALWGWGARVWAMPVWHDVQLLAAPVSAGAGSITCATSGREFRAGGLALLRGVSALETEVVEVEAVTGTGLTLARPTVSDWPAGTRLYPVLPARLTDAPSMARVHDQATRAEVAFLATEPVDVTPAAPATTYRGWPVLTARPDETEDLTLAMQRLQQVVDNATGRQSVTDTAGHAFTLQGYRWVLGSRAEHAALRALLYYLQGRFQALWVPTFADDLTLVAQVAPADGGITIANVSYSRFAGGAPGRKDIRIELRDGTVYHRRITGATEDGDTEVLSLSPLGATINPSDVARISFMALCRLDQDDIELLHETDADGITTCSVIFRSVRDEL